MTTSDNAYGTAKQPKYPLKKTNVGPQFRYTTTTQFLELLLGGSNKVDIVLLEGRETSNWAFLEGKDLQ